MILWYEITNFAKLFRERTSDIHSDLIDEINAMKIALMR
jgi:hypothetical protein